jgi:hypothetical protein
MAKKKEEITGLNTISKYGEEVSEQFNVELIDLRTVLFSDITDQYVGTC